MRVANCEIKRDHNGSKATMETGCLASLDPLNIYESKRPTLASLCPPLPAFAAKHVSAATPLRDSRQDD